MAPMMAFADQVGSLVTPVIAFFDHDDFEPKPNEDEVEFSFEVETDRFLRVDEYRRKSVTSYEREHYFHYFNFVLDREQKRVNVWGMTSYLGIQVASALHSRLPSFEFDPERKLNGQNFNEFNEWYILDKSDKFLDDLIVKAQTKK